MSDRSCIGQQCSPRPASGFRPRFCILCAGTRACHLAMCYADVRRFRAPAAAEPRRGRRTMGQRGKPKPTSKRLRKTELAARRAALVSTASRWPEASASRAAARHFQWPATERRQFRAPDAGIVPAAIRGNPSRAHRRDPRRAPLQLSAVLRPGAATGLGARPRRHSRRRYRLGHAPQRAGDGRGALRRADAGRRAQHHQYAPRARNHRLHPASMARPRS